MTVATEPTWWDASWSRLRRLLRVSLRGGRSEQAGERRLAALVQGAAGGFGHKVLGILISFVSVPLTVGYLGPERYGAWITIGSLLAWMQLADLGLGNGLTNAVTNALGKDRTDRARIYISSGVAALTGASIVLSVIVAAAWPFIDWSQVLGVRSPLARSEVSLAVALAIGCTLLNFPISLVARFYMVFQKGAQSSLWSVASNIGALVALLVVTRTQGGLPLLVLATTGVGLVITLASGVWLFVRSHPEAAPHPAHVRLEAIREVSRTGAMFFLLQTLGMIAFQTDNLVIARYLSASEVAPYSLVYRLFGYTMLIQTQVFWFIWVAYGDALARGDVAWVRKAYRTSVFGGAALTGVLVVPLCFIAVPFIQWWTGGKVTPTLDLVAWMAVWSVINAFTQGIASLFSAANHLRNQIIYSSVSAVLNIGLSIYLVRTWGPTGVIAGTVIAYAVAVCIPSVIDAELLLKRLSHRRPASTA